MTADRTAEFRQILAGLAKEGGDGAAKETTSGPHHSELNVWASEVGTGIHEASVKVQELRKLAGAKGIYRDRAPEIQELTFQIQQELGVLQQQVETFESRSKASSVQGNYQKHARNIVDTLKGRLLDVGKEFKEALQIRTSSLQSQEKRRSKYTSSHAVVANPFGKPTGNPDDVERGGTMAMQAQEVSWHSSRAEAVQSVQRTIGELAQMFQRMAVMVSAQEDMVQRIDQDVDDTLTNIERGQQDLLKYFKHISQSRRLILKVMAILFFFVIFFVIFLA